MKFLMKYQFRLVYNYHHKKNQKSIETEFSNCKDNHSKMMISEEKE